MENINFVLSGLGGQGILFMTKLLARSAVNKGLKILVAETHGMAQRGGSVISHLRVGDVKGSVVRAGSAHILLALEENEAYRNIPYLADGGKLYANAPKPSFPREEVRPYLEPMSANLALLGFFSAFQEGPISYDELKETIAQVSPDSFRKINLKVFDKGFEGGSE
ncbi:MAG: 2-oxoacid:acceptor oxidoreductase family protein [Deltaproteobacteria bacterium]|nr:2-oxoacid:acceptor oxidoreductase family protein [Deltaproteobacteria bacterium]